MSNLSTKTLEVPQGSGWTTYTPVGVLANIKSVTTIPLEYTYDPVSQDIHILAQSFPPIEFVGQTIYFRNESSTTPAKLEITEGVSTLSTPTGGMPIGDGYGNRVSVDPFGKIAVSMLDRKISQKFDKVLDTLNDVDIVGTPVAQYNGTMLRLQPGDSVTTQDVMIYQTGDGIEVFFTASFESVIGDFTFAYRNLYADAGTGTVGTAPDVESDPIDISAYDLTKTYIFKISLGYLGVAPVRS